MHRSSDSDPGRSLSRRALAFAALATVLLAACSTPPERMAKAAAPRENPDILWHFVHDQCTPAASQGRYPPAPCVEVTSAQHPDRGYAVFKDRTGAHQYLVLPLARIPGIESPLLLRPDAPNYLADAWTARMYTEAALHRTVPREDIALVVNSAHGRSQNQLHIHVDCVKPTVRAALRQALPQLTTRWTTLPMRLPDAQGDRYIARWVGGAQLSINPFKSLAQFLRDPAQMQWHSLVVVGAQRADGQPGFVLLSTRANAEGSHGNSDDLHDRSCAVAFEPDRG